MTLAFRTATDATSAVGSAIDVYGPPSTGVVSGDLTFVAWLTNRTMASGPSGFATEWGPFNYDAANQALYRNFAGGSEPANYLCSNTTGLDGGDNIMFAFSGADTTTPIETGAGGARIQSQAGGVTLTAGALTPLIDGCMDVGIFTDVEGAGTIVTPPPSGAGWAQARFVARNGKSFAVYYRLLGAGTAGVSTGTVSITWSNAGAFGNAQRFLVRPAVGGGGGSGSNVRRLLGAT